jgi:aminoglycoside phosphotransferase family enzyme/predicted kinase
MELTDLISALSDPSAYPDQVDRVEVRQTHMSVVFLAGGHAYKLKKPVEFEFADLSTIDRRRAVGHDEVRLNQRLAPEVYEAVVPVRVDSGRVQVGRPGEPAGEGVVDWLVRMRRLPEEARLSERLAGGQALNDVLVTLACRLAAYHNASPCGPEVSAEAGPENLRRLIDENLDAARPLVGRAVHRAVLVRLRSSFDHELSRQAATIARRGELGRPREGHGDLRLEHVYHFPGPDGPGDMAVLDCIEFDRHLRMLDPVCDVAFLSMELAGAGRPDLASEFLDAYLTAAADPEGHALVPLYSAYRASVRAKVMGLAAAESEMTDADREGAIHAARRHWLLALGFLDHPDERPLLLLVGGLPGAGKSTLAMELARSGSFSVLRSDLIRKELAPTGDRYVPAVTEKTYKALLEEAEALLFEGRRVLVDASFSDAARRGEFLRLAIAMGVPCRFIECVIDDPTARKRLRARVADASEADFAVRRKMSRRWQPPGLDPRMAHLVLDTQAPASVLATEIEEWLVPGERD